MTSKIKGHWSTEPYTVKQKHILVKKIKFIINANLFKLILKVNVNSRLNTKSINILKFLMEQSYLVIKCRVQKRLYLI